LTSFLIFIESSSSGTYSLGLSKYKKSKHYSTLEINRKKVKLLPGKIYFEGWLRFFKYSGGNQLRPSHFFKNPEYLRQTVSKANLKKKDSKGFLNIKDEFAFYAQLNKDQFSIFSTRYPLPSGDIKHVVDNLQIKFIKNIPKENRNRSSVNDIGNFKEGKCLQVYTKIPQKPNLDFDVGTSNGKEVNWIFCFDNVKDKKKLITYLILLKENQQKDEEKTTAAKPPSTKDLLTKKGKTKPIERRKDAKPKDGYWILLQDWTSCSLKCGGGKSYQHWMCVPPKKGGRKCQGQSLRTRPCNTQPCPVTKSMTTKGASKEKMANAIQPAIVRSQPFSNRPQNYIKCEVRENDVLYMNRKVNKNLKIPARLILNTRTISLFTDENFKDNVFSFNLKETEFTPFSKDKCCFNFESGNDIYTICGGFGQKCGGGKDKYSFVDDWRKSFNLFKFGCFEKFKREKLLEAQVKKAEKEARESAGLSIMEDRANLIKRKMQNKEVDVMAGKVNSAETLAMKAIKREFDIEKMITSEIRLKSQMETKMLLEKKKHEEKKQSALEKAFAEKKEESERKMKNKSGINRIKSIKNEAKREIIKKRQKMRNKIKDILKREGRRKKIIEGQIRLIRSVIAKKIIEANHKGSKDICIKGMENKKTRKDYCDKNVVDSYVNYKQCILEANFCDICCGKEFGNMFIEERDKCISSCENKLTNTLDGGEFV
jgi:hypothetical protein